MSKLKISALPARTARRFRSLALVGMLCGTAASAMSQSCPNFDPPLLLNCWWCSTGEVVTGPDGELWFTQSNDIVGNAVGKVDLHDNYQIYPLPTPGSYPTGITAGPDGNLWVTEQQGNNIARVTTAGAITEFPLPSAGSGPTRIARGPDGNLWFTESAGRIGRISPAGAVTEFPVPTANSGPAGITAGPDGNLWFTESLAGQIGKITPAGSVSEFPLPPPQSYPAGITSGPDGNLWFTMGNAQGGAIGRMTTAGTVTEYPLGWVLGLADITRAADGNLWFTTQGSTIGWITPSGVATTCFAGSCGEPCSPHPNGGVTRGPDGDPWFTFAAGDTVPDSIVRIHVQAPATASSIPALDGRGLAALAALLAGAGFFGLRR
jgi:streptogramin lyase